MDAVNSAVEILKKNGLIVYPTDTLYGIGGNPFNEGVIKKIFEVKKRPNVPISVAVSNMDMIKKIAFLNSAAVRICEEFLPGPVTVVLLKKKNVPPLLTAGSEKIGIRIPDNRIVLEIINSFGPITCTSANIHKGKNPVDIETAERQLGQVPRAKARGLLMQGALGGSPDYDSKPGFAPPHTEVWGFREPVELGDNIQLYIMMENANTPNHQLLLMSQMEK